MIISVVGAGGKTTYIHNLATLFKGQGKRVFVTTSTHMYRENDTILSENADEIITRLEQTGYVMAGTLEGEKIKALPYTVYQQVCCHADVVLVEADGSKGKPLKFPNATEPVIYDNTDEIVVVWGIHSIGRPIRECVHRPELAADCLGVPQNAVVNMEQAQTLLREGYLKPLAMQYPNKKIRVYPTHDGSLFQRAAASLIQADMDVTLLQKSWFAAKPSLVICGGGHVALEVAQHAGLLDFRIKVMDDRPEFANRERFPMAETVICDNFDHLEQYLEPNSFYVVLTRGHGDDLSCVKTILEKADPVYLGMIGSKRKVATTLQRLREEGIPEAQLQMLHAPIGLPIGAVTPGEIAISILAQIIQEKNSKNTASASAELLESQCSGILCVIIEKHGSSPRGVGSMMLVTEDATLDSIGGGPVEFAAIQDARENPNAAIREYSLNNEESKKMGMICGGKNTVLFIPV